ncbi:UvrD/REP helicase [Colletotrichum higginsianum IMI 349063]|uniref:UvrD/REP helicase n=2 Tax=Colletotrichum higginsianum TaxID=80884 RepID=A0A1B7YBM6_COLHI|nr:UvrD/REP helicase [Colletotrichum higginsianum IMI 349063]OBR09472.1 UvrD/REP helicase [Colletotrichum higginsianum IMI 349063]TIC95181.1 hypothetical protein CH35J_007935 [Colletotrichum higginsianum]GJC96453.1 uvrD/rep helicase [Colletotrichum higginsianum]
MSAAATARIATKVLAAPTRRAASFSTVPSRGAGGPTAGGKTRVDVNNKKSGESAVEVPVFDLRHITSSPRARFWLISALCVAGSVEMYGWYTFGPRILGWEEGRKGDEDVQGR